VRRFSLNSSKRDWTLLVLVTNRSGLFISERKPPIDYKALFQTVFGTAAAAAGAAALNQWWEPPSGTRLMPPHKDHDRFPAGRMAPLQALVLGATLSGFRRRLFWPLLQNAPQARWADGNHHCDFTFLRTQPLEAPPARLTRLSARIPGRNPRR